MVLCKEVMSIAILIIVHVRKVMLVKSLEKNEFNPVVHPVVHTKLGSFRGLWAEDGDYAMFLGVPYAEVDKSNPFGNAIPNPKFDEIFDAFNDTGKCPQTEPSSLDCLNLNIYVPRTASTNNTLPVLVWIYGGMFSMGSADKKLYGPKYLVRHDIIFIAFNYRVGPYGFMCLDIPEVPGNQGLKDQIIALKWIKENIAAFGGDKTRITVDGNSAGATSVDLHLYFNQEEIYHRTVIQSGGALKSDSIMEPDYTAPLKLAKYFGYYSNDKLDALSFLVTVRSDQIIKATGALGLVFRPCVEKSFPNVTGYVTEYPVNFDKLRIKDIDIMIGFNNDESYYKFAIMDNETKDETDFVARSIRSHYDITDNYEHFNEMKKIVTQFYVGEEDVTLRNEDILVMDSDFHAYYPTYRSLKKYLENGVRRLYLYLFSYEGGRNFLKRVLNLTGGKAAHADELGYQFSVHILDEFVQPDDQIMMDTMTTLWTNFVKFGNPTPSTSELIPLVWPCVTPDKLFYLELDSRLRVGVNPYRKRMAFHDLFYMLNHRYLRNYIHKQERGNHETDEAKSRSKAPQSKTDMKSFKSETMRSEL